MPTPEEIDALMLALEPFTAEARRRGFEEGREQGVLSVYNGILRYGIRTPDGNQRDPDDMTKCIQETEAIRLWMERVYPIIRQTYPVVEVSKT